MWQYTRTLYGLRNATAHFQQVMDHHIREAGLEKVAVVFVDDILIYSNSAEEHLVHVCAVMDMLQRINIKLHPEKTVFAADVVEFLGHMVSADGLRPMQAKVAAICAIKPPTTRTELLSMLGLMNYYRCYLPHYSEWAAPAP